MDFIGKRRFVGIWSHLLLGGWSVTMSPAITTFILVLERVPTTAKEDFFDQELVSY